MRKLTVFILLILVMFLSTSCDFALFVVGDKPLGYTLTQDSYEPGDNGYATTNEIGFGSANRQPHSIYDAAGTANDMDFIKLNATSGKYYKIQTYSSQSDTVDTFLSLRYSNGSEAAFDDNGGGALLSQINWWLCPATATYFIVVSGRNTGYYDIDVEEFNGAFITAPYTQDFESSLVAPWNGWVSDSFLKYAGSASIKTPVISDNQATSAQLLVEIPSPGKTLTFFWQVNSEPGNDCFAYSLDGTEIQKISGNVSWTQVTSTLLPGRHVIKWEYKKNGSKTVGYDCGWLDNITIQ